ncbi:hypothetical protein Taro_011895 [Colocasia esculenta]|uniref:Uncharacterized protein n=1 Tax=Colocasia esculenta TaxID=4460 RepID=A0A843U7G3_COLES|nr:hypothetical protein [Colocasia esculenta]
MSTVAASARAAFLLPRFCDLSLRCCQCESGIAGSSSLCRLPRIVPLPPATSQPRVFPSDAHAPNQKPQTPAFWCTSPSPSVCASVVVHHSTSSDGHLLLFLLPTARASTTTARPVLYLYDRVESLHFGANNMRWNIMILPHPPPPTPSTAHTSSTVRSSLFTFADVAPASQHQASPFPTPALLSSRPPPLGHLRGVELSPPSPLFPCKSDTLDFKL